MSTFPDQLVTLRPVTSENFDDVIKLSVREDQKGFVASNVYSLAESKVFPELSPLAIYAGDTLVGFTMFGLWKERNEQWIMRLMVDQHFQGRGYGRAAMQIVIETLRNRPGFDKIFISYEPHNTGAKSLYASLGFIVTGDIIGGEEVAVLNL